VRYHEATMNDSVAALTTFDSERIEVLGGALIAAASAAGIGVSVVSLEEPPQVVYISDKGVEILGHPRAVLMARPAVDFLTPAAREARTAVAAHKSAEDRPRTFETMAQRADGHQFPIEIALAPIRLDGRRAIVVFMRDITERRRGLEALERSERRFRQLIELAPDAVWINDGKRLCFANPTAARMLRYESVKSLIAADPRNIVAPEDQASMRERTLEMFRTGQPLPPRNYRTLCKDGTSVLTEVHSIPIDWDGAPAILGFARDITARKEMEARLAQSERLASLGTLLGGIAHEMNNPLAYTLLGIEQALQQLDRLVGAGAEVGVLRETLESAHHGATRVAAIVGQLRASLRSDAEERGPVDVRPMLESALRVTANELKHRARVVTELQNVPPVLGTASLEQVFMNLLVNAAQALPKGRADNEVRIGLRATTGGEVIIEVADNGAGIPDEVRPRIFDPFFTTKPVGVGLGLGLSICHGIVTNHGGTIIVESAVGRGSTFRVTLPALAQATAAPPEPAPHPELVRARSSKRLRVLVVDDEPTLGAMIRLVLERECDVDVATDARQGLERLESAPPYDVVLCDLMMPHITGMDLFAEVARRHPGLERRFVFMTGGAFTPREANFLAGVVNRRLEKPFDAAGLWAVIRE
jgi:PAS domain S-box-containing protein